MNFFNQLGLCLAHLANDDLYIKQQQYLKINNLETKKKKGQLKTNLRPISLYPIDLTQNVS